MEFLPGDKYLISGSNDGTIRIWDVQTGEELARVEGLGHLAQAVRVMPDGKHAVSFGNSIAYLKTPDPLAGDFDIRVWRLPESVWPNVPVVWGETASILTFDEYEWTEPVNLGPKVNSSVRDGNPWISADGLTLLFSSTRPGSVGNEGAFDIWQSTRSSVDEPLEQAGQPRRTSQH